jgi:hypothetical protein
MKRILYLGIIFVLLFGCLGNTTPKTETKFTEDQSKELALQSVKNTAEYKLGGKDLKLVDSQTLSCQSCWTFEYSFGATNELGGTSYFKATVTVTDGKASSVSVEKMIGGDTDAHGCIGADGYEWCEAKQKCIRSWEENCTTTPSLEDQALSFCETPNVAEIYTCGEYVRVVSSLLGGGSTFFTAGDEVARCPVVGPDSISEQCNLLLNGNNCIETQITCPTLVGGDRDAHGCIPSAGYTWCEVKQSCIRAWEEPCSSMDACAPSETWCTPLQKCIKPWEEQCN